MDKDNTIDLKKPERFVDDPITNILPIGARKLLAEALRVCLFDFGVDLCDICDRS